MYSGFIDLLGTKEAASLPQAFHESIVLFHRELAAQSAPILNQDTDRIYPFSDCAFFEIATAEKLIAYLTSLRSALFSQNRYFKCGITYGPLEAAAQEFEGLQNKEKLHKIINGSWFGKNSVASYLLQDRLKGVGCIFSDEACKYIAADRLSNKLKSTFFLSAANRPTPTRFTDIGLLDEDQTKQNIDNFLDQALSSFRYARKNGRYYLSHLSLLVTCGDYTNMRLADKLEIQDAPYIYTILFESKAFARNFHSIPGIEFVYMKMFNSLFESNSISDDVIDVSILKLSKGGRKLLYSVEHAPEFIMPPQHRASFIRRLTNIEMERIKYE